MKSIYTMAKNKHMHLGVFVNQLSNGNKQIDVN